LSAAGAKPDACIAGASVGQLTNPGLAAITMRPHCRGAERFHGVPLEHSGWSGDAPPQYRTLLEKFEGGSASESKKCRNYVVFLNRRCLKMSKLTKVTSVSAEELAELWGVTDRTVRQLAEEGVAVRVGHGKYDRNASTTRYINHLRNVIVFRQMGVHDR